MHLINERRIGRPAAMKPVLLRSWRVLGEVAHFDVGVLQLIAMAKPSFKSVDEYIASQPDVAQGVLECVRATIRKMLPGAGEMISYNIPTYKIDGKPVIYFAGWKQHFSLYPVSERILADCPPGDVPHNVKKATIRFPLAKPVPVELVNRIVKLRLKEVASRE
jgi:uncharacterized protein YdhG (YjbR/CyaY superfamily)